MCNYVNVYIYVYIIVKVPTEATRRHQIPSSWSCMWLGPHDVGAWNQIQILWKSRKHSQLVTLQHFFLLTLNLCTLVLLFFPFIENRVFFVGVMVIGFNPITLEAEGGRSHEFEASLVYRGSFRTASATYPRFCLSVENKQASIIAVVAVVF